jgi:hypothetical protein
MGTQDRPSLLRGESLSSQAANVKDEIDPAFINDQIWLLFPLHVSWDSSADVEDTGMHNCRWERVPASGSQ